MWKRDEWSGRMMMERRDMKNISKYDREEAVRGVAVDGQNK